MSIRNKWISQLGAQLITTAVHLNRSDKCPGHRGGMCRMSVRVRGIACVRASEGWRESERERASVTVRVSVSMSQGVGDHEMCVQRHQLNKMT